MIEKVPFAAVCRKNPSGVLTDAFAIGRPLPQLVTVPVIVPLCDGTQLVFTLKLPMRVFQEKVPLVA